MTRLTKAEVLRRYQAGERDFRGADLRSLRLRCATLAGSDFSGADLRGTDLLGADLREVKFIGCRCGLPLVRSLGLGVVGFAIGFMAGFIQFYAIAVCAEYSLAFLGRSLDLPVSFSLLALFLAGIIGLAWEGFNSQGIGYIVAGTGAFVVALAGAGAVASVSFSHASSRYGEFAFFAVLAAVLALLGAVAVIVTGALAVAVALAVAIAGPGVLAGALVGILVGGDLAGTHFDAIPDSLHPLGNGIAVAVAFAATVSSMFIAWWRSNFVAPGYAGCRSFGIVFGSIGATRFSGADLRGAFFTDAQLARCSFAASRRQATRLERVCWRGAKGLDLARPGATILAEPRCRQLLLTGSAPGSDLHGLNLRGAYLPRADLRGADLRDTNLSETVLTEAHLENANLKASQCLGTDLKGAHLTGATLEAWNIDRDTNLHAIDCTHVYLLEPFDELGQRRDDHDRERLPHDPKKSIGPGDFETYFKQLIEEVKLLFKNGIDAKAFQQALQEVMRQHPQITPKSVTSIKPNGDDVLVTLQPTANVDKGAVEQTFFANYNALKLENVRLQALLEGERQRSEDRGNHAAQLAELAGRLIPPANPTPTTVTIAPVINPVIGGNNAERQATTMNNTSIHTGDGSLVNTGSLNTAGGMVNLGALSDQARITIEALPERRLVDGQPSLRELLQELKASVDVDPQLPENTRAEALTEVTELANAAQDPQKNVGPARRAINALKGLSAGLSETNKAVAETSKLVGAVKTVLPLIAGFFVG